MDTFKQGDIILVNVAFHDKLTKNVVDKGKRPCVIFRVKDGQLRCRTITSQNDRYPATKYGVQLPKDSTNNLKKDSAILCTKDNTFSIPIEKAKNLQKVGVVSTRKLVETANKALACNRKDIQLRYSVKLGTQHSR